MNATLHYQQTAPSCLEVIGFSGSPRKGGNSDSLLQTILAGVQSGQCQTQAVNLSTLKFQGCIGCERCRNDHICTGLEDDLTPLYENIVAMQGMVLVCPTHNYNVTAWMKAFVDRLYCFYNFGDDRPRSWSSQLADQNRVAVVAAICEQESEDDMGFTMEAMTKPLEALGYRIVGQLPVLNVFDRAKVNEHQTVMDEAYQFGQTLAQSISSKAPPDREN